MIGLLGPTSARAARSSRQSRLI